MPRVQLFGFVVAGSDQEAELWRIAGAKFDAAIAALKTWKETVVVLPKGAAAPPMPPKEVPFEMRGFRESQSRPNAKRPFRIAYVVPLESDDGKALRDRWRAYHNDAVRNYLDDPRSGDKQ